MTPLSERAVPPEPLGRVGDRAGWLVLLRRIYPVAAWGALVFALLTVTVGGVVRVTGSGLGCPDWPLCHGRAIPPPDLGAWLEYSHRLVASLTTIFTVALTIAALVRYRLGDRLLYLVLLAPALLLLQVALGAITVLTELSPAVALTHTGVAMAYVGVLALAAVWTAGPERWRTVFVDSPRATTYRWAATALALVTFLLILSGAYVTRTGASLACMGFPLCGQGAFGGGELQWANMAHRAMAALVGALMLGALGMAWMLRHRVVLVLTSLLAALLAVQVGLGASNILLQLPAWARGTHLAVAALFFASATLVVALLWRGAVPGDGARQLGSTVKAYLRLTKPRIIVLLLITTLAGMLAAAGGAVPWETALATIAGGFLCAGGAGALNSFLDKDCDRAMDRTRRRPLASGLVSPRGALVFAIAISLLSLPLLLTVNVTTAVLAVVAWLYYVFFYSVYLKGRTTQNIVIGGAAGAFPPLIGWVAVTGALDMAGLFLFLIVFMWTPPHAWALAILAKDDYQRVQIPMLPVLRGEAATSQQILLYSTGLLAVSILPGVLGYFGPLYLATVTLLGGILVALAVRLYRNPGRMWAARLYRYSSIYLALLFVALVLDRALLP